MLLACKLPIPLFLTTLSLLSFARASAASTASFPLDRLLTNDNFAVTTATGLWFIEFFSPYCGHCRVFAPTWRRLVEDGDVSPDVNLARVDCSLHGDLCNANNVIGYPQMNFYRDGAFVEKFEGKRDYSLLFNYLASLPVAALSTTPAPDGVLTAKTPAEFTNAIGDGLWFVLYSTSWCGHCKWFAPTWERLVASTDIVDAGVRLARVDCEKSSDVCNANDIKGYPQLNLYRKGVLVDAYSGSRDFRVLSDYLFEHANTVHGRPTAVKVPNPHGEVSLLTSANFTQGVANGPTFIHFQTSTLDLSVWSELAAALTGKATIAEVPYSNGWGERALYFAYGVDISRLAQLAGDEPVLMYFPARTNTKPIQYFGPRTLEALQSFVEADGETPAVKLTAETYQAALVAPFLVMVFPKKDAVGTAVERLNELAGVWRLRTGENGDKVMFAWDSSTNAKEISGHRGQGRALEVMRQDDHLLRPEVVIIERNKAGHEEIYLDDAQGSSLRLTEESLVSSLQELTGILPVPQATAVVDNESVEGVADRVMQFFYAADTYVATHPWQTLNLFTALLTVMYLLMRRVVKAPEEVEAKPESEVEATASEAEVEAEEGKGRMDV
ncbi:protein disulfide isomerase [Favolaschia claudopus]|uniref:Protein disulfide isomerase n=1 Tax=Favolaschia claudopus TaxID=2862362 RepID=A0AAW0CYK0_9AGAR